MALLLCWVVGLQVAAWHTQNRQQQLEQQVAQRFQEVLPNTPMVADPLLLIERELKQSTGMQSNHATAEQGLLLALHTVAKNMPEAPSHTLKRIALEGKSMQLAFAIAVSPETQNRVATALQAQGYSVAWEGLGNAGIKMNSLGTSIGTSLLRIQTQETP
jgi:type II secretory pathway component PulL